VITVTTLQHVRCSVRPERIVAIGSGSPTTLTLDSGLCIPVRESPAEVKMRLEAAGARTARVPTVPAGRHGPAR
jgi:uncharacterized protein YlzI (FlbEa/FlbD family)